MKAARLENSARLRRVADLLANGREYSTLDIIMGAGVCAVNSCIAELRDNGFVIHCRREGNLWFYRMEAMRPPAFPMEVCHAAA